MSSLPQFVRLDNEYTTIIFDCQGRSPSLLYMGETLSTSTDGAMLSLLRTRQEAKCAPVVEPPVSLVPTHGEGFAGAPGLEVFGQHDEWSAGWKSCVRVTKSNFTRRLFLIFSFEKWNFMAFHDFMRNRLRKCGTQFSCSWIRRVS